MDWLKRNLFLIGWGALALGLTVVAVLYLLGQMGRDDELDALLAQKRDELVKLYESDPQPTATNVATAKNQQAQVQKYLADSRKTFGTLPVEKVDVAAYRKLLEESLFQLTRDAQGARVGLPQAYKFTFKVQSESVRFSPGSIEPLVARLGEIKTICRILFDARVHSLDGLRRASVAEDDSQNPADVLLLKPVTNAVAKLVSYPYEVTFTGFSRELGVVMDALEKEPVFFVVKSITVDPAPSAGGPAVRPPDAAGPDAGAAPPPPAPDTAAPPPPPALNVPRIPGAAAARPGGPVTILDEKLLRITLALDVNLPTAN